MTRAIAQKYGVGDRVFFAGRFPPPNSNPNTLLELPHEGLVDAIAAADVGVLTSFVESYNITAAEQGAAGLPLILTQQHGVRDRIPNEYCEFVLDVLDESLFVQRLVKLRSDESFYNAYSAALKGSFGELTPQKVAQAQLETYRTLVKF